MLEQRKNSIHIIYFKNIAGRLPENSRNNFVDLQSQKTVKQIDQKIRLLIEG